MGVIARLKSILGSKIEKGLDKWEDPKDMLDYSIVQMEQSLQEMTRNTIEITAAKKKLERQRDFNLANVKNYEQLAEKALEAEQEDLAREALTRKNEEEEKAKQLEKQINSLTANLKVITTSQKELKHKIELYRAKKEELKATYDASRAQLKIKEIMASVSDDTKNIVEIVDRAENKIRDTEARVLALDELISQGVVAELIPDNKNDLEKRLSQFEKDTSVEDELAKLKEKVANKN